MSNTLTDYEVAVLKSYADDAAITAEPVNVFPDARAAGYALKSGAAINAATEFLVSTGYVNGSGITQKGRDYLAREAQRDAS